MWDMWLVLSPFQYPPFMSLNLTGVLLPHPMIFPMSGRLLRLSPEFRAEPRITLKEVCEDIKLPPPVDVYASLGVALEVLRKLRDKAQSTSRKSWFLTAAGKAWSTVKGACPDRS